MCDVCHGYGHPFTKAEPCPRCGTYTCPKCRGYGHNGYNSPDLARDCEECNGLGRKKAVRTRRIVSKRRARYLQKKGKNVRWTLNGYWVYLMTTH